MHLREIKNNIKFLLKTCAYSVLINITSIYIFNDDNNTIITKSVLLYFLKVLNSKIQYSYMLL